MSRSLSLALVLLCLYNLSFLEAINGGFSVEMIHRDSSRSPFFRPTETRFQRVANAMRRSINRANHLNQSFVFPNSPKTTVISALGEYLMSYSVGTPSLQVFGIVDTGSDIIWLQCQPCKKCYKQTTPIFDSSKSQTYKTLPCPSNTCQSVQGTSCSSRKNCLYSIDYADGSHSQGDLSVETLTLGSTNGSPVQFPGTVIGCGRDNAIGFEEKNSGIVGLGRGPVSLITQLSPSKGGKFSYCLVPGLSTASSKLNFGDAAVVSGRGTVSTPLFPQNGLVFYFLTLEAFSVGRNRIEFGSPGSGGKGNIIIDSGTTLTALPNGVYSKLESAVAKTVKLQRVRDPNQVLGLCYKVTPDKLDASVPVITAHFSGADVTLNAINTFVQVADDVVCFAFQPTETGAIFGNLAQQNLLVEGLTGLLNQLNWDCSKVSRSIMASVSLSYNMQMTLFWLEEHVGKMFGLLLRLFFEASVLKANFSKSKLYGVYACPDFLESAAAFLYCSVASLPFKFLWFPIGANHTRGVLWAPVINLLRSIMKTSSPSTLALVLFYLCNIFYLEAFNGGFSVEMIHRDSSRSPFFSPTETQFQRVANAVHRSINRANHLNQSFVSPNSPETTVISALGEYLISYSVGTPSLQVFGILDTGSDIIWLQCQPCKKCYEQTTPIFDSSKSQTYKTLPCPSNTCQSVQGTFCSSRKHCLYSIHYVDGSQSLGDLSVETLTLGSTNGSPVQFPGTVIGCGRYNAIGIEEKNSGIVGLGRGPMSLITQLSPSTGGKFSYCLVPGLSTASSKLNFGNAAVVSGRGTVSTPLFSKNGLVFYFLTLEAFSVGRNRIEFGSPGSGGKGNIIIDSGTTLTALPNGVYSQLESAVAKTVILQRVRDPNQVLGLCYKVTPDKLDASVPVITAHFSGADVTLNAINTFVQVADDVVCFAFQPTETGAVFGNLAQQNLLVEGLTGVLNKSVELGLFKGFKVNHGICFSKLQYADDSFLVGGACWENLWAIIKAFLRSFELASFCTKVMKTISPSTLALVLFYLCNIFYLEAFNGGFSVEMIHRDSSRSPFFRPTETQFQRVANAVHRSVNRANHFHKAHKAAKATITQNDGEYLISYSVGIPPFQLYGIIDTGSDMIWLQCKPCEKCYNQTTPIFDPSKSNTYKILPFSSTTCQSVEDTSCSSDNRKMCEYTIYYGDGSYSQGDLSVETLTLGSTNGSSVKFRRTVIGCGRNNTVSFEGKSSGIVGLGNGPVSLINQLRRRSSSIGRKFSYCLASMSNISSKLNFGDAAVVSGDGTVSTPIVTHDPKVFYYLTLEAFSVGNNRIEFTSSSFRFGEKGNIIIDSGTTLTLLPNDIYSKLESAVADLVELDRVKDPLKQLSLCYRSTFDELNAPVIMAHFSGADVKLNAVNTFIEVEQGVTCLAFISSKIGPIFGNMAQQNFLVGYDLQKKIVSFKPTDCSKQ
ncbi:Aspartic proteinase CDR1 [Glycine max]|nr:Aspartic proteinase CDR1 [Glycine max]